MELAHAGFETGEDIVFDVLVHHPPDVEEDTIIRKIRAKKCAVASFQELDFDDSAGVFLGEFRSPDMRDCRLQMCQRDRILHTHPHLVDVSARHHEG